MGRNRDEEADAAEEDTFEVDSGTPRGSVNRRERNRVTLRMVVEVESVTSFFGLTANISPTGVCVVAGEELPVDSLIELEFHIPRQTTSTHVLGEIRWKRPMEAQGEAFAYGIAFLDLSESDRAVLASLTRPRG